MVFSHVSLFLNFLKFNNVLLQPENEVWGKVMFLNLWFCSQGVSAPLHGIYNTLSTPPQEDTPGQTPPSPPEADTPWILWDKVNSGRYVSYWNAYLFYS